MPGIPSGMASTFVLDQCWVFVIVPCEYVLSAINLVSDLNQHYLKLTVRIRYLKNTMILKERVLNEHTTIVNSTNCVVS